MPRVARCSRPATTDASGNYTLTAPANTSAFVRAKALSVSTGSGAASWDIRVLNNFEGANSLYAIEGATFDTGVVNHTRNLRAASGWNGFAGYSSARAAAPFAILDTLYAAVQFVIAQGDPALRLGPLEVFWSPENRPTNEWNPARGWIVTTAYRVGSSAGSAPAGIYVLGAADNDIDEYDQHIVAHEFQHFLEDQVSRSDTPGGPHSLDEQLDMRVSFSEGFANAFSAMVLNDPVYRDAFGASQGQVYRFDVERGQVASRGWFNETSVQAIAWDLFDAANDDNVSIGYGPMHRVLRDSMRDGTPLTSIFSFITPLKQIAGVPAAAVDARVEAESIVVDDDGRVRHDRDALRSDCGWPTGTRCCPCTPTSRRTVRRCGSAAAGRRAARTTRSATVDSSSSTCRARGRSTSR